jgi:hypothetical protein
MTDQFIFDYISKKEKENINFIRYSYYELKIKSNLTDEEIDKFLKVNRDYFENKGYKVYFTNARYEYNGAFQNVQPNELMIAFKE